ncbi:MAG: hypothetical protein LBC65_00740, partial [Oscillospiraceae bacterium]|nr:hypothetical protein [Oscillospiraceae bacterium]
ILGLIHLNDGTVTWNIPRSDVGATIDAPAYHRELSIRGNLVAQANLLKQAPGPLRISSLMQRLKIDEITAGSRSMRNLLTYQTQAAAIAMAMLGHPDLLLLDEPLVALNLECRLAFIELFNEEYRSSGKTALITAESKDDLADLVSDFIHIDGGKNA